MEFGLEIFSSNFSWLLRHLPLHRDFVVAAMPMFPEFTSEAIAFRRVATGGNVVGVPKRHMDVVRWEKQGSAKVRLTPGQRLDRDASFGSWGREVGETR